MHNETIHNDLIYDDLLGKPFRLGGRGPNDYDCWGLCLELGRRVGLAFPNDFTPSNVYDQDALIRLHADDDFERLEKPEPYCIVTFRIKRPFVDHCGFVLPDVNYFLHTMYGHNVSRHRMDNRVMFPKREGLYRLKCR